jgi:hypothetical protein
MGNQSSVGASGGYASEAVIPFAPVAKSAAPNDVDQLDTAGRTILSLLHKAAGVAEENSKHALDLAQKLSQQLKAAENRIAELETNVRYYQDRTERAEEWLHKIYSEIEEQFFRPEGKHRGVDGSARPIGRRAHENFA